MEERQAMGEGCDGRVCHGRASLEEENPFSLTPKRPNKTQSLKQKEPRRSWAHFYARTACKGNFDQITGEAAFQPHFR